MHGENLKLISLNISNNSSKKLRNIAEIKLLSKLGRNQQIISLQKFHDDFDV